MAITLDWQKRLGYRRDPFALVIPRPVKEYLVGDRELQERLNLFLIKGERIGTLTGPAGSGKTTFLRWIDEQVKSAFFIDAAEQHPLEKLLEKTANLLQRKLARTEQDRLKLLAEKLKGRTVLVDNASNLTDEQLAMLLASPAQIILADETMHRVHGDTLRAHTPHYTHHDLVMLLAKRIGGAGGTGTHPFDDDELLRMAKAAQGSPLAMLRLARERAIELSLKATPQKPKGLFTISVDRAPAQKQASIFSMQTHSTGKKPAPFMRIETSPSPHAAKEPQQEIPPESMQDAAKLNDVIAQVTETPPTAAPAAAEKERLDPHLLAQVSKELEKHIPTAPAAKGRRKVLKQATKKTRR